MKQNLSGGVGLSFIEDWNVCIAIAMTAIVMTVGVSCNVSLQKQASNKYQVTHMQLATCSSCRSHLIKLQIPLDEITRTT
jgi:hypothetical protein